MASLQDLDLAELIAGSPSGLLLQSFNALTNSVSGALMQAGLQEEDMAARSQEQEEPMLLAQLTDKEGLSPIKAWMKENPEKDPSQYKRDIDIFTTEGKATGRFSEKGATGVGGQGSAYKGGSDTGKKNPDDVLVNGTWVTQAQYQQLMRRREQMKQEILLRGGSGSGRR